MDMDNLFMGYCDHIEWLEEKVDELAKTYNAGIYSVEPEWELTDADILYIQQRLIEKYNIIGNFTI